MGDILKFDASEDKKLSAAIPCFDYMSPCFFSMNRIASLSIMLRIHSGIVYIIFIHNLTCTAYSTEAQYDLYPVLLLPSITLEKLKSILHHVRLQLYFRVDLVNMSDAR